MQYLHVDYKNNNKPLTIYTTFKVPSACLHGKRVLQNHHNAIICLHHSEIKHYISMI